MFPSSSSNGFFSSNDSFTSTLSDEEILEDMIKDDLMVF